MAVAMVAAVAWQKHNMESDMRLMSSNHDYRLSSIALRRPQHVAEGACHTNQMGAIDHPDGER